MRIGLLRSLFGYALYGAFLGCAMAPRAFAVIVEIPSSLEQDALSETVPTAFAPDDWDIPDYSVDWVGPPIPGVNAELEAGSLQWVREADVLVIPRAKLKLTATGTIAGMVTSAGFNQGFSSKGGVLADIPVALISGETNAIKITAIESGHVIKGELRFAFRPRKRENPPTVGLDSSCSRFHVQVTADVSPNSDSWAYVGCRLVTMESAEHRTASLELLVFWDGVGQEIRADGIAAAPVVPSLWAFRERSEPGKVSLEAGSRRIELTYAIPENFHYGSLGAGIGPYLFDFNGPSSQYHVGTALLTLYGSYFLTESSRIVAFDATAINDKWTTDFGLFVNTEQFRLLDRRIAVNFMLGAHVIGFSYNGTYVVHPGAPQGVEAIFNDAFGRGKNLSLGGFVFPEISGKAYYNLWLRFAQSAYFVEANYILWKETVNQDAIFSRSVGVSIGFPLARFF